MSASPDFVTVNPGIIDFDDRRSVMRALGEQAAVIVDSLQREADLMTLADWIWSMAHLTDKRLRPCIWEAHDIAHTIHGRQRERYRWDVAQTFVVTPAQLMDLADVPDILVLQDRMRDLLARRDR